MGLELYRIDDRLIHGQVVVGWGQPLDVQFLVLVDDEVAGSEWEQELYRMGVPPEMEVYFESVASAVIRLAAFQADPRVGILLTGDIDTMRRLVLESGGISAINLGGVHHKPGRTQRLRYLFLSKDEEQVLLSLVARGTRVSAQDVPAARPLPLAEVLAGEGNR
ncbi:MAG: PTS sugar transporter subunit IIB [Gemmatimonadaceae bacterium]|nr:PTS sugar transporter subunit IIB [Gemmatimonadaceae bacterium]